jgi:hypothetical protein
MAIPPHPLLLTNITYKCLDDPPVGCYAPNTCLFTSVPAFGVAYCGVPSITYGYFTACSDYSALATDSTSSILQWFVVYTESKAAKTEKFHSQSSFPYCHTVKFIADSSDTYTMFGCDSWEGPTTVAYPIAGAVITTQSDASPTNTRQQTTGGSVALPGPSTIIVEYTPSPASINSQSSSPAPASSVPSGINTAAAIGGALGGFASVVVAILAIYQFLRKRKKEPLNP